MNIEDYLRRRRIVECLIHDDRWLYWLAKEELLTTTLRKSCPSLRYLHSSSTRIYSPVKAVLVLVSTPPGSILLPGCVGNVGHVCMRTPTKCHCYPHDELVEHVHFQISFLLYNVLRRLCRWRRRELYRASYIHPIIFSGL